MPLGLSALEETG
jgi:hypothetical protein